MRITARITLSPGNPRKNTKGQLHRGAQGCAGDIGHIRALPDSTVPCRCGQLGCLEALAGGNALIRQGQALGEEGRSPFLATVVASGRKVALSDIGTALDRGDSVVRNMLAAAAQLVGDAAARIVNFYNPGIILIGGAVSYVDDVYLSIIRQTVLGRSLPLATRDLRIVRSQQGSSPGLTGGAYLAIDELMSRERLGRWIGHKSPAGHPELVR